MSLIVNRLNELCNLQDIDECRRVISVLAGDLELSNSKLKEANERLQALAVMVLNLSPDLQNEAKRIMFENKSGGNTWKFITTMVSNMEEVSSLLDKALVDEVLDKVWGGLDLSSTESALLGELIERFKQRIGNEINVEK